MTEDFLHYLWKFQRFNPKDLKTIKGESILVQHPGYHNTDAGPDFLEAKIFIGQQLWAGQVEIHITSSDWYKHNHQGDENYDNVILHVVYQHDKEVLLSNGEAIPTLMLQGLFDEYLYWRYEQLVQNQDFIPCARQVASVDPFLKSDMLERTLIERLQRKTKIIESILSDNQGDWERTLYHWLAYGYGLKVNTEPMLRLAKSISPSIIGRLPEESLPFEALFLGQSGILGKASGDEYGQELKKEYHYLSQKFQLEPLQSAHWKYSRLRPPAFPEFRIALFAALVNHQRRLFSHVLETGVISELTSRFESASSTYWSHHYRLGKPSSSKHINHLGPTAINLLLINVVVPFLFLYGQMKDESFYRQRALDFLDQIKPEKNKVTRGFEQLGFSNGTSFESQALLELYAQYCKPKKCLNCGIGNQLLKN